MTGVPRKESAAPALRKVSAIMIVATVSRIVMRLAEASTRIE
jgi:hypothetical protein